MALAAPGEHRGEAAGFTARSPVPAPPATMARLPRARGRPVPYVAAWSTERWTAIRHDPHAGHPAVFTGGRPGRGRAVFGVMNEPRQRQAVAQRRCGICAEPLDGLGWYPNYPRLATDTTGDGAPVTTEPPCCQPCAAWSAVGCPGIAHQVDGLLRLEDTVTLCQLVDPARAPAMHDRRFDGTDNPAERERLGRIARRHGGAVGYLKTVIVAAAKVPAGAL